MDAASNQHGMSDFQTPEPTNRGTSRESDAARSRNRLPHAIQQRRLTFPCAAASHRGLQSRPLTQ